MKIIFLIVATLVAGICCGDFLDAPVGGVHKADVNDAQLRNYLEDALKELNAGEVHNYEVITVFDATKQLVAGDLYKFRVTFKVGEARVECAFKVWEQVWIENGREVTITCDNEKKLTLKQKPGRP